MIRHLVFRLYAPMASWGAPAVGEERPTNTYPGRSAIVGMLAAASGIRREEAKKLATLNDSVLIAVKQRSAGRFLRDFHTAQVPPTRRGQSFSTRRDEIDRPSSDLATIISRRDYRSDGLWIVAVRTRASAGESLLDDLEVALKRPRFALYLGRRACPPAAPLQPRCVPAANWREALDYAFDPIDGKTRAKREALAPDGVLYAWEGDAVDLDGHRNGVESSDVWDVPRDRQRWQFAQRREFRRYVSAQGGE